MSIFASFQQLPAAKSAIDFMALPLSVTRADFLAKASDGCPVFLLQDSSPAVYSPAIELQHLSVQFHNTCRVTTTSGTVEDQFAVISCSAISPELNELFVRCFSAAIEQLPVAAGTGELQRCVRSLFDVFRALSRPSSKELTGLWGELFVIAKSKNVAQALRAWRADQFERFDFSWSSGCLEIKAAIRDLRQHDFALEQLQPPVSGNGYVASILLQPMSGGVGIMEMVNEVEDRITGQPELRQKLWANTVAALGSEFSERLDRKFDMTYAERSLAVFLMIDVPAPHAPTDPRVSALRFRADLSTVASSLNMNPRKALDSFFE